MRDWLPNRSQYIEQILKTEAPIDRDVCSSCGVTESRWRCLNCMGQPSYCPGCCQKAHFRTPFHRVQKWDAGCYEDAWLEELGVIIHLGHRGVPCSIPREDGMMDVDGSSDSEQSTTRMIIIDESAVHHLAVAFCRCNGCLPPDLQLLEMSLYPASSIHPRTAFTFGALTEGLLENLENHTAAKGFYSKLRRKTNISFPQSVPVRNKFSSGQQNDIFCQPGPI